MLDPHKLKQVSLESIASPSDSSIQKDEERNLPQQSDDIPDGGYGWVCVGACFSINCFTWGVVAVNHLTITLPQLR